MLKQGVSELTFSHQNTGMSSLSLLQGIFPTQGSNSGLLHYRQILYQLSYQGSPLLPQAHQNYNNLQSIYENDLNTIENIFHN